MVRLNCLDCERIPSPDARAYVVVSCPIFVIEHVCAFGTMVCLDSADRCRISAAKLNARVRRFCQRLLLGRPRTLRRLHHAGSSSLLVLRTVFGQQQRR